MAGRMGGEQITTVGHKIIKVDAANGLLVIKGPLPGPNGAVVFIILVVINFVVITQCAPFYTMQK